ncbi:MAG: signal peptidase I [Chloroherpetonaceae bacterium]|nr:signal peptidase I [Chthonomonadaceae bacterium]MDW8206263.1 signal peptidase I [Chloroherpetonaceae bacterium]
MGETGATEFLANLSAGMVVTIAFVLTIARVILVRPALSLASADRNGAVELSPFARGLAELLESFIIAGVLVFLIIRPFFVQAFYIPSESMEPTLLGHNAGPSPSGEVHAETVHDHIFVNKLIYRFREPQHGDIIVFRAPRNADMEAINRGREPQENVLIKRLIGLPGDTIEIKGGKVYRNGTALNEPVADKDGNPPPGARYAIKEPMRMQEPESARFGVGEPLKLGPNELYVMGDNRNDSNDSRYWGTLKRDRVIGKAMCIFLPLNRIRILR